MIANQQIQQTPRRITRKHGECHHRAKLEDNDVVLIRRLHEEGLTNKVIAEKFECSVSNVQQITAYKTRLLPSKLVNS